GGGGNIYQGVPRAELRRKQSYIIAWRKGSKTPSYVQSRRMRIKKKQKLHYFSKIRSLVSGRKGPFCNSPYYFFFR
uniref:Uncharacterized protein n=1 Tax=Anopheles arabiensis TaxID=7173 RepID=A0A182IFY3_ANOAR